MGPSLDMSATVQRLSFENASRMIAVEVTSIVEALFELKAANVKPLIHLNYRLNFMAIIL